MVPELESRRYVYLVPLAKLTSGHRHGLTAQLDQFPLVVRVRLGAQVVVHRERAGTREKHKK